MDELEQRIDWLNNALDEILLEHLVAMIADKVEVEISVEQKREAKAA